MFLGTHFPRLDDKGRLVLPAKFRDALAPGLVLAKGQNFSIEVWPAAQFAAHAARLSAASRSNAQLQAYERMLFSGASDEIPDRQGRITVPAALRDYARLTRDIVVVGRNDTAEIWDAETWRAYETAQEQSFSALEGGGLPDF